ncbi:MAG TPA: hypothetical protein VMC07_02300 [Candidatus Omnitrophota bacterium]|nr:hypothetical protein [Candidatus Omnitrophota bacterium]
MDKLPKEYVSVDIEANGQYPWSASMLSIGACIVSDPSQQFYAELKPVNEDYLPDNFKIGARGLLSLRDYDFSNFNPEEVLAILAQEGEDPNRVIPNFAGWVLENTSGRRPILCADNLLFDGMFLFHYLDHFYSGENPFGHTGENIQSVFRGKANDMTANLEELSLRNAVNRHNALIDAVNHAREFHTALVYMRQNRH